MVLERSANGLDGGGADVGRRVDELPVLAARFADDARVREVVVDVLRDVLPERLEDVGRAREVEAREVLVLDDLRSVPRFVSGRSLRNRAGETYLGGELDGGLAVGAGEELDDVLGESGLEEDLEDDPGRVRGSGRGLPQADVSDESRSADEVASDGGEVERRDGEDEALEGAVLDTAVGNTESIPALWDDV